MYLFHISLHGLVRGKNLELGRNSDTGGQITYVLNLLEKLSASGDITKLELATRGFNDADYDKIYGAARELLNDKTAIVRFFDNESRFLRKEALWPKLPQLRDAMIAHLKAQPKLPDAIHAHYADAGWLGAEISRELNIPYIFTGHSLGKTKREAYLEQGLSEAGLEEKFNISKRIAAEEKALRAADAVIVSTEHERDQQYANYPEFHAHQSVVLVPGYDKAAVKDTDSMIDPELIEGINRFLHHPERPPILAIARPDSKKNLDALMQAYAEHPDLRNQANLVIFAGKREDIREEEDEAGNVFEELFYLVDKYDLYGHVAMPKSHTRKQIPDIYAYAVAQKGVFANVALQENFGLTLVEAAANGLPVVATSNGGPADIVHRCRHGQIVDPCSTEEIGQAIHTLLSDSELWQKCADNARNRAGLFTWDNHAKDYLKLVKTLMKPAITLTPPRWMIISDIDHTLTGDAQGIRELHRLLEEMPSNIFFAVATGRSLESACDVIKKWNLPKPQALLTSVGSEIIYDRGLYIRDRIWADRLNKKWQRTELKAIFDRCPELKLQPEDNQALYKLSYYVDEEKGRPEYYNELLTEAGLKATVIYSYGHFLDILPHNASKACAMEYLRRQLKVKPEHVIAIGDSGNDLDMLTQCRHSVVVGNHHPELQSLSGLSHVVFVKGHFATGAVEGIRKIMNG